MPEGWAWCRLPNLCKIPITDGTHQTPTYSDKENGIPFLSSKDVTSRKIDWSKIKYITKELHEELQKRIQPCGNDILLAKNGTTGVAALVDTDKIFDIYVTLAVLRPAEVVHPNYLQYVINSPFCKKQFNGHLTGIGVPNLHLNDICKTIIPLPPLIEQHRIVTAIETIFTQIDILETNKADLQTAVKQAKSKILDLAIHGKLVPQDPADEPASVMLERLRAEKEAKIAAGEIKCRKNDSYIYKNSTDNCYYEKIDGKNDIRIDDELLFELPKSWQWTKLGRICDKLIDGDHNPPKGIEEKTEYIMVSSRNINYNTVADLENVRYLTKEMFEAENLRTNATAGDILFTSVGSLGRSCIYDGSLNICFQRSVSILKTAIYNKYLKFFFDSKFYQNYVVEHATGTAQTGFYLQEMAESFIAIPPILEQKRIVAKIEELFNALDKIQNNLI